MNPSHPAVSVIVPVYKVERWLPRCLDSLLAQTCPDWEAICVDDGSPDGCGAILDEYAAKDARFRVIHKENAGVSAARNLALEQARGEFLLFVDSDDFIHPQLMEICLTLIRRDESDLVAFTYDRKYRTKLTIRHYLGLKEKDAVDYPQYDLSALETKTTVNIFRYATERKAVVPHPRDKNPIDKRWTIKHCQPWRCLYRTERIRDIRFIDGIIYEDFPWWSRVMLATRKTTILNLPLYYYYPNFGSYIHSASQNYRIDSLKKAIDAVEAAMTRQASAAQYDAWYRNFRLPFEEKLSKKQKKSGLL